MQAGNVRASETSPAPAPHPSSRIVPPAVSRSASSGSAGSSTDGRNSSYAALLKAWIVSTISCPYSANGMPSPLVKQSPTRSASRDSTAKFVTSPAEYWKSSSSSSSASMNGAIVSRSVAASYSSSSPATDVRAHARTYRASSPVRAASSSTVSPPSSDVIASNSPSFRP